MLIATDDALESAIQAEPARRARLVRTVGYWSRARAIEMTELDSDKKARKAIDLLSDFAKDFPLKDPTSDSNIGGTITGEVKKSDKSKSATTILQALKNDLHSNVKFPSVYLSLNADRILANDISYYVGEQTILEKSQVSYP